MHGKTLPNGEVTITFNSQHERLAAPGGQQWLPCCGCGHVEMVGANVVSFFCPTCWEEENDEVSDTPDYAVLGGSALTGRE